MKKTLISLALAVVLTLLCVTALAVEGKPGDEVTVNLNFSATNATYASVKFSFNSSVLTFVSATSDGVAPQGANGSFVLTNVNGISSGNHGSITFKINDGAAAGTYNITATVDECYDKDDNDLDGKASFGSVTVKAGGAEATEAPTEAPTVAPTVTPTEAPCTHEKTTDKVTKEATCTEDGEKQIVCDKCGEVVKTEKIPATGHVKTTDKVTKEATCTEAGEKEVVCDKCGEVVRTETIKALGHDKGEWITVKKPTKEEKGLDELHCTRCGELLKTRETSSVKYMHNNVRSAGEKLADLKAGVTEKWYTATPLDLSQDGEQTFELISGDYYAIGTVTVAKNGDSLKVTYQYDREVWEWKDYTHYTIFADAESITGAELEEIENLYEYGTEYSIEKDLGGDTDVLLYTLNKVTHER